MLYSRIIIIVLLSNLSLSLHAQWGQYEATWENEPGIMSVNLDIKKLAPVRELSFLLEVTQRGIECDDNGILGGEDLSLSEERAVDIDSILSTAMYVEDVGTLLYQCEIKNYYYIQDSAVAYQILEALYGLSIDYKIVEDKRWKVYLEVIYPDDFLLQTMIKKRTFNQLHAEGFNFEEKTLLEHFASFSSEEDRHDYRRFLIQNNYKIIDNSLDPKAAHPYVISFSRKDMLHLERLSNITLRLHQKAISLAGTYGGWGVEL